MTMFRKTDRVAVLETDSYGIAKELRRAGGHYYVAEWAEAWTPRAGELTLKHISKSEAYALLRRKEMRERLADSLKGDGK